VIPREDVISSLLNPSNLALCRTPLGIPVTLEQPVEELQQKVREAASEVLAAWSVRLAGKPLIELRAVTINSDGKDATNVFQLGDFQLAMTHSRRVVIEAPAGRGQTTTLLQLAAQHDCSGRLPSPNRPSPDSPEFLTCQAFHRPRSHNGNNGTRSFLPCTGNWLPRYIFSHAVATASTFHPRLLPASHSAQAGNLFAFFLGGSLRAGLPAPPIWFFSALESQTTFASLSRTREFIYFLLLHGLSVN
jgi:hypothetical protein